MIEIDQNSFLAALNTSDKKTKSLMGDSRIHDCILDVTTKFDLKIDTNQLILPFGYTILGLITRDDLRNELTNYGISNTEDFIAEILSKIENTEAETPREPVTPASAQEVLESIPANNHENVLPSPAYTEPTYTTTQAAILQEGAVAPSAPSNAPAAPRWESEQV